VKKQKIFDLILADLQNPFGIGNSNNSKGRLSYKLFSLSKNRSWNFDKIEPEDYIVHSEEYGIPQARHRIIVLGIRSDIFSSEPGLLREREHVFIEDVIGDLPKLRSGLSKEFDSANMWHDAIQAVASAKWLKVLTPSLRHAVISASKRIKPDGTRGSTFMPIVSIPKKYQEWFVDEAMLGICNHETRAHIRQDLHRYFYAAVFARENGRSPVLEDFPRELLPLHKNVQEALDWSKFNDRFRVQVRGRPSTTVVSHISKDGHYFIHYDPAQCRSLTVREAARLQTFPDNYFFEGPRTEQYQQVGNAVPPMLAYQIAQIVADVFRDFA